MEVLRQAKLYDKSKGSPKTVQIRRQKVLGVLRIGLQKIMGFIGQVKLVEKNYGGLMTDQMVDLK